jgi:hypothetical protein
LKSSAFKHSGDPNTRIAFVHKSNGLDRFYNKMRLNPSKQIQDIILLLAPFFGPHFMNPEQPFNV